MKIKSYNEQNRPNELLANQYMTIASHLNRSMCRTIENQWNNHALTNNDWGIISWLLCK